MDSYKERRIQTRILRQVCGTLSIGLLILIPSCKPSARSVEHAEVSGKVIFKGQPLPGGTISFVAVIGGFSYTGLIDENGNYKVNAPEGEVRIGVLNKMLLGGSGKADSEAKGDSLRQEKTAGQKKGIIKGRYVRLPFDFGDPIKSGLKYTVKPGPQTHDVEIPDNPPG